MEGEVMLTPHRILSTCRMWDCRRFAATYCSVYHADQSLTNQNSQRAAVYVNELKEVEETALTEKILQSMSQGHPCGIPRLPAAVLQQNPWNFPHTFHMNQLENENTRHFICFSDLDATPTNIWSRYDIKVIMGYVRYSWLLRPQPEVGRYRLRRYTLPGYAGGSLFLLKFDWNKLKKRPRVTISVPKTQQEKTKEDPGPDHGTGSDAVKSGLCSNLPLLMDKGTRSVEALVEDFGTLDNISSPHLVSMREYMGITYAETDANLLTKSLRRVSGRIKAEDVTLDHLEKGIIMELDAMEDLLRYAVFTGLGREEGNEGHILSTDPLCTPKAIREKLLPFMFETFNVSGLFASAEKISGCIVYLGHRKIDIAPGLEGAVQHVASRQYELGGTKVTKLFAQDLGRDY